MIDTLVLIPEKYWDREVFARYENEYNFILAENPTEEQLEQAEVIIGQPKIEQISKCKKLKWIQLSFAGMDYYTCHKEKLNGIVITNASGAYGPAISEYVLAMTLSIMKKLHGYRDNQNNGVWKDLGKEESIVGKKVLVVGAGNIGTHVARLFKLFGCEVDGIRRRISDTEQSDENRKEEFDSMNPLAELDGLLECADIVVLSLPSTKETWHIMNENRLNHMKKSSILINVGRGSLIDTDALVKVLQDNRILGAGLDVLEEEPLNSQHPLWTCKNAIITPHITGGSFGHLDITSKIIYDIMAKNIEKYAAGEVFGEKLNTVHPAVAKEEISEIR